VKPAFIIDSSVALTWCFPDEATPHTRELLQRMASEAATVPVWWFLEISNVLALAQRKGRITAAQADEFITLIESFDLEVHDYDASRIFHHVLPLCRTHQLTSYDALYLELARSLQLPLATLDIPLRKAASALGVQLLGK